MKIITQGDGATVRLGGDHTRLVACKLIQEAPDENGKTQNTEQYPPPCSQCERDPYK